MVRGRQDPPVRPTARATRSTRRRPVPECRDAAAAATTRRRSWCHPPVLTGGNAVDDGVGGYVSSDDRTGADEGVCANPDAGEEHSTGADLAADLKDPR